MDWTPGNRERNQDADRKRMPKHGVRLAQIYRNAIEKRLKRKKGRRDAKGDS